MVLANALGRQLLTTGALPYWWPDAEPLVVVISEGEPDYLTWSTSRGDGALATLAVFGVYSGAWCSEVADRVPTGARVVVRSHDDRAGNEYAGRIAATFGSRCTVRRPCRRRDA
ncbi:MAG: hypothetical protein QGG40_19745 [Myxococcota bacterium]|nr:hypothetical protein [Myxococcota bacterium]